MKKQEVKMARAKLHPIFSFTHTILQISHNFKVFLAKTVIFVNNDG